MKWDEIVEGFKDVWVLIDVKEVDENFGIVEGDVIAHARDKEGIYNKLLACIIHEKRG